MQNKTKSMENTSNTLGSIAQTPLENGLMAYQLTTKAVTPPLSFYDPNSLAEKGELKDKEKPCTPCYIPLKELNAPRANTYEGLFEDFKIEKDGNLKLSNDVLIKSQKGILGYVIKKAATKILEGKSIVGLSLPVRIFEARSTIERVCDLWTYAPHFLTQAAGSDGTDRIRAVMAFISAALPHSLSQWKPFNPLLGETFQGVLPDGTTIDCEHTSHHPPITTMLITAKHWRAYGSWCYNGDLKGNTFSAYNEGWTTIEFNDGHKIKFFIPSLNIKGMMMGSRRCQYWAGLCVKDETNKLKGVVKFNIDAKGAIASMFKSSRQDTCKGAIYTYDPTYDAHHIEKQKRWIDMVKAQAEMKDMVKQHHSIDGSWIEGFKIDGDNLWNLKEDLVFATPHSFVENPLPSDCRFREDLIWLFRKNQDQAQIWKVLLEEQQRKERK